MARQVGVSYIEVDRLPSQEELDMVEEECNKVRLVRVEKQKPFR